MEGPMEVPVGGAMGGPMEGPIGEPHGGPYWRALLEGPIGGPYGGLHGGPYWRALLEGPIGGSHGGPYWRALYMKETMLRLLSMSASCCRCKRFLPQSLKGKHQHKAEQHGEQQQDAGHGQ